jgi:hydrogenase maturation factor
MAVHELATAAQVGIMIEANQIPILEESALLCRAYGLDPLGTIASGALLIATPAEEALQIQQALQVNNIACAVIGRIVPPSEGVLFKDGSKLQPLPQFIRDEITKLFTE